MKCRRNAVPFLETRYVGIFGITKLTESPASLSVGMYIGLSRFTMVCSNGFNLIAFIFTIATLGKIPAVQFHEHFQYNPQRSRDLPK